jgi:hypothetical protein
MMNNRAVGIGLFTLGLSLAVIFSNRTDRDYTWRNLYDYRRCFSG